jgi:hypothetical protein
MSGTMNGIGIRPAQIWSYLLKNGNIDTHRILRGFVERAKP